MQFAFIVIQVAGNKLKGRISERMFQENKARQIFRKTNISNPLIRKPFAFTTYKAFLKNKKNSATSLPASFSA